MFRRISLAVILVSCTSSSYAVPVPPEPELNDGVPTDVRVLARCDEWGEESYGIQSAERLIFDVEGGVLTYDENDTPRFLESPGAVGEAVRLLYVLRSKDGEEREIAVEHDSESDRLLAIGAEQLDVLTSIPTDDAFPLVWRWLPNSVPAEGWGPLLIVSLASQQYLVFDGSFAEDLGSTCEYSDEQPLCIVPLQAPEGFSLPHAVVHSDYEGGPEFEVCSGVTSHHLARFDCARCTLERCSVHTSETFRAWPVDLRGGAVLVSEGPLDGWGLRSSESTTSLFALDESDFELRFSPLARLTREGNMHTFLGGGLAEVAADRFRLVRLPLGRRLTPVFAEGALTAIATDEDCRAERYSL